MRATIQAAWEAFEAKHIDAAVGAQQRADLKFAYHCGAAQLFNLHADLVSDHASDDKAAAMIVAWHGDLLAYLQTEARS